MRCPDGTQFCSVQGSIPVYGSWVYVQCPWGVLGILVEQPTITIEYTVYFSVQLVPFLVVFSFSVCPFSWASVVYSVTPLITKQLFVYSCTRTHPSQSQFMQPENILLSGGGHGNIKLIDFGSARDLTSDTSPVFTSSVEFCGMMITQFLFSFLTTCLLNNCH